MQEICSHCRRLLLPSDANHSWSNHSTNGFQQNILTRTERDGDTRWTSNWLAACVVVSFCPCQYVLLKTIFAMCKHWAQQLFWRNHVSYCTLSCQTYCDKPGTPVRQELYTLCYSNDFTISMFLKNLDFHAYGSTHHYVFVYFNTYFGNTTNLWTFAEQWHIVRSRSDGVGTAVILATCEG